MASRRSTGRRVQGANCTVRYWCRSPPRRRDICWSGIYALDLGITTKEEGLAINTFGDTRRYNLVGSAAYSLRDTSTGTIVTSGTVNNFTAYSATGSTVATLAAERDALERLMVILGDQITTRLFAADLPT